MAGCYHYALRRQPADHGKTGVELGGERDDARQSAAGVEQPRHPVEIGRPNRIARMRAAVGDARR